MDSFEQVVATILDRAGYWVRTSVKVPLTAEEKREIGRPSSPRWELDVVAYSGRSNELLVVECKSYLDSAGVRATSFDGSKAEEETRYKLFTDPVLRRVVLGRLEKQLTDDGFCPQGTKATLCLAAGRIYGDPARLREIFQFNGWRLFERRWLVGGLQRLADESYDNSVASVVAKVLLREGLGQPAAEATTRRQVSRERLDTDVRRNVLITALYLSRFGHEALGLGNQDQTFERAAGMLDTKKHTLKNYRDSFDPHTESGRRGWWQVDLSDDLRAILQEFGNTAEADLRAIVLETLGLAQSDTGRPYSTSPGFTNANGQTVVRATGMAGTDHGQSVYELRCDRCGQTYGANGSDIWLRKCPACQGGQAGPAYS